MTRGIRSETQRFSTPRERRQCPRFVLDLPLEYRMAQTSQASGGILVNASEAGFLIDSVGSLPLGAQLNTVVLFPKEFELTYFKALVEIIWKDLHWEADWEGYRYGARFIRIHDEDQKRLRYLLGSLLELSQPLIPPQKR